jgi:MATE family multidrug resistance protein
MLSDISGRLRGLLSPLRPKNRWGSPQGYRELLALCLPLILSNLAATIMMFTDRVFLGRWSITSIAASFPSGLLFFTTQSVFLGLVTYSGIFAAQYVGAGRRKRAAAALWQGLYLSLGFGFLLYGLFFVSGAMFQAGGHSPEVVREEVLYFNTLLFSAPLGLSAATMSSFLSSLGRTRAVMCVGFLGAALNILLDYFFLFGLEIGGGQILPPMGIFGAALATDISMAATCALFAALCFSGSMERGYGARSERAFDPALARRLVRYGWPSGLQIFLEVAAFLFFSFAMGWLDPLALAASNMALSLENLTFFPIVGVGQAVSILTGRAMGAEKPEGAERAAVSGIVVSVVYASGLLCCFFLFPRFFLGIFTPEGMPQADLESVLAMGAMMLRFVVLYSLFDGLYVSCFGVLRGAGDVVFPMLSMGVWSVLGVIIPITVLFQTGRASVCTLWLTLVAWVFGLTITLAWRYRGRKWMARRIIEPLEPLE